MHGDGVALAVGRGDSQIVREISSSGISSRTSVSIVLPSNIWLDGISKHGLCGVNWLQRAVRSLTNSKTEFSTREISCSVGLLPEWPKVLRSKWLIVHIRDTNHTKNCHIVSCQLSWVVLRPLQCNRRRTAAEITDSTMSRFNINHVKHCQDALIATTNAINPRILTLIYSSDPRYWQGRLD